MPKADCHMAAIAHSRGIMGANAQRLPWRSRATWSPEDLFSPGTGLGTGRAPPLAQPIASMVREGRDRKPKERHPCMRCDRNPQCSHHRHFPLAASGTDISGGSGFRFLDASLTSVVLTSGTSSASWTVIQSTHLAIQFWPDQQPADHQSTESTAVPYRDRHQLR